LCILTPNERNLNIAGAMTGRGLFCVALPDRPGPAQTIEGGWCAPWRFAGGAGFGLQTDQHLHTLLREVGLALGDSAAEAGFGFLIDQHLQTLSRDVGSPLGHSAGEA